MLKDILSYRERDREREKEKERETERETGYSQYVHSDSKFLACMSIGIGDTLRAGTLGPPLDPEARAGTAAEISHL